MKSFQLNRNSLALIVTGVLGIGFFVAGLLEVLDYFIIKALLFGSFGLLVLIAFWHALKNNTKKNRPRA